MSDASIKAVGTLLGGLPGQFLALVLLNTLFVGGLMWFLQGVDANRVALEREELTTNSATLKACLERR